MKKDKLMYNPPVVEPLVIRFEGNLLVSSYENSATREAYADYFNLDNDED